MDFLLTSCDVLYWASTGNVKCTKNQLTTYIVLYGYTHKAETGM